jgi:hypothetical protein
MHVHLKDGCDDASPAKIRWEKHWKEVSEVLGKYSGSEYFAYISLATNTNFTGMH